MANRITLTAAALGALCLISVSADGFADDTKTPKKASAEATDSDSVARYCANAGPALAEIRLARQIKRLTELEIQVKQRIQELDQKEAETREWVNKRESMLQKASDAMVAIFSKMDPEAAAARLGVLDDETAAAVLAKLSPRAAGAILNEMEASRAGKLTSVLSGALGGSKKS